LVSYPRIDSLDVYTMSCYTLARLLTHRRLGSRYYWIGDRFHPVVSCRWRRGFYRPRCGVDWLFDRLVLLMLCGRVPPLGKLENRPTMKNPAGLRAQQGSRKSMIWIRS
jgi:hypothetical protein